MRTMCLLNKLGDTTISWTPETDDKMMALIQKKMKEGITFYIVAKGIITTTKTKIDSVFEVGKERKVVLDDEDLEKLFYEGGIEITKRDNKAEIVTVGIAKTAEDVKNNTTVGVRQQRGG